MIDWQFILKHSAEWNLADKWVEHLPGLILGAKSRKIFAKYKVKELNNPVRQIILQKIISS